MHSPVRRNARGTAYKRCSFESQTSYLSQADFQTGSVAPSHRSSEGEVKLTFVNLLHELNASQHPPRVVEVFEAEHRPDAELYAPMVLFHDVVQVRTGANLHRVFPAEIELVAH